MSTAIPSPRNRLSQLAGVEETHRLRNPRSERALRNLARWLPGGDTRTTTWFEPFPLVIEHATGALMFDLDGHQMIDFIGNYTALVHGHGPPAVTAAIQAALARGTVFAAPLLEQGELAARLVGRIPSIELIRFTNSGTEANLIAVKIARAATGRQRVAIAAHSYHGSYEALDWRSTGPDTVVFPANDVDGTVEALGDGRDLAAVIIEPVLGSGGVIPVTQKYLSFLRDFTHDSGSLFIFDEVMTMRLAYGGLQEALSVKPDLTTLGKVIGGGLPIGAVGGAANIMETTDPRRSNAINHSGTFNGNRLAMVAGAAALDMLDREAIARINLLGEKLANGIIAAATSRGLGLSVTSYGSLLNLHSLPKVRAPAEAQIAAAQPMKRLLHLKLLERGIFIAPRGEICTSTAMDETTIDVAVEAIGLAFDELSDTSEY